MTRLRLGTLLLLVGTAPGCAVLGRTVPVPMPLSVEGLELPLVASASARLAVQGTVNGRPAEVQFEPASPLTVVGSGCAPDVSWREVAVPSVSGTPLLLPLGEVARVELAGKTFTKLRAGVVERAGCFLRFGNDVLAGKALSVDPARRQLSVQPGRTLAAWEAEAASAPAGRERFLLRLEKHPTGDWPLLPARLQQGSRSLDGAFVLALSQSTSTLSRAASDRAGFTPALPDAEGARGARPLLPDALGLQPGLSLANVVIRLDPEFQSSHVLGLLGADTWGRFKATVDPAAGALLLERVQVTAGVPARCSPAEGEPTEAGCFEVEAGGTPPSVALSLHRDEPRGARVYVQGLAADGTPVQTDCRIGFSVPPSDRGTAAQFTGSWADLARSFPECAASLASATRFAFERHEPGPSRECSGLCAFAAHVPTANEVCRCAPPPLELNAKERATIERARLSRVQQPADTLGGEEAGGPAEEEPDSAPSTGELR
ncbi:MAG: hypothetical protein RL653_4527 [Pseudomonadota bacterium]|jgi:hypothetical protein